MSYRKIANLVDMVAKQTADRQLSWDRTEINNAYQVSFSEYVIRLFNNGKGFRFVIYDVFGDVVEEVSDRDLKDFYAEPFEMMNDLFGNVRRQAMGVDEALDSIMKDLRGEDLE